MPPPSLHTPPLENVDSWTHQPSRYYSCSNSVFVSCLVSNLLLLFSEPVQDAAASESNVGHNDGDQVRPPLPVIRETLYDDAMLYGYVFLFLISCFYTPLSLLYMPF